MRRIALLILCCCFVLSAFAQYYTNQNKIWNFGIGARIDFNSGIPVPLFSSSVYSNEGCATVCNTAGGLLFYTDGYRVYNRLAVIMPGGGSIVPFGILSSTQGSLIVPFLNDTNKFYVFSLEQMGGAGRLAYCIVDMTLDGGLGGVLPGAGTIIDTGLSEKMIAIPGNACNIWLVTHKSDSAKFYAREITSAGISTTPVVSYEGTHFGLNNNEIGVIKCSHDRQKIVAVTHQVGSMWGVELFDFNPSTGIVSNCQVLEANPPANPYGAEFSPDNSKLYTSGDMAINQWDITLPTTAAIIASKVKVDSSVGYYSDLRLAPDGKIYYSQHLSTNLDRIDFPNLPGAACNCTTSVVALYPATCMLGFPNLVWRVDASVDSVSVCAGSTVTLIPPGSGGTWSSSTPAVATVGISSGIVNGISAGTTAISYSVGVGCPKTTIITVSEGGTIGGKLMLCETFSTMLSVGIPGGSWSSSSPNATVSSSGLITGISAGTAIISYFTPGGCVSTATMTINSMPTAIVGPTTVASGTTITLASTTSGGSWISSDSTIALPSTTGGITGMAPGTATIYYTLPTGCKVSVVITVTSKNQTSVTSVEVVKPVLYPNPATNEIIVKTEISTFTSFTIYNAMGQQVTTHEITGAEMNINVKAFPPGEYQVVFKGSAARETIRFTKW